MSGQKCHGDVDSENSQAGKNLAKTMGCAGKISQEKCLAASEESGERKMKAFNSAAERTE
jgi:hypothetical protein